MFLKKHIAEAESLPERHRGNEHHTPRLRPYVDMIISAFQDRRFQRRTSVYQKRDLQDRVAKKSWTGPPSETIYGGISVCSNDNNEVVISLAVRDTTYFLDFSEHRFPIDERAHPSADVITDFVLLELRRYEHEHLEKFVGMALPRELAERCPHLCPRLWRELDIVPLVLHGKGVHSVGWINREYWDTKTLDEQAESVARKCITFFGPNKAPLLQVGYRGCVEVDCGFHAVLATLPDYELTVGSRTWNSVLRYAEDLKKRKVKVAFFSATPQGGGVALMRHALVRFAEALGVDFKWYVPRPRPAVFRITKTNHNIFQGVSKPDERLTEENKAALTDWIVGNAKRYWLGKGGPLCAPPEGGADIIVIDDPQMPGLIPLIKEVTPLRPVIYRSHIQMRSDLIADPTTPQAEAWNYFWDSIKCADLFISHPVASFVPHMVPPETVGYLPASTDWLDGLNKPMDDFDSGYYGRIFNAKCREIGMTTIDFPDDEYIVQIARFDPSKGIFDVLDSYEKFRVLFAEKCLKDEKPPKLLVCGHGSVDDPDGVAIYDAVIEHIEDKLPHLKSSICVMHIPPSDQILNALLSKARVALQLSTREGFEVKVSEALHKGKPVIATLAGGIPLQVQDGKNGFLVEVGDTDAVAQHLFALWTDDELYYRLSSWAADSVSDEVSTVGNALSWLYLASELSKGRPVAPHERWINDLAREEAGEPYGRHENRLRRTLGHDKGVGVAEFGLCLRKSRHAGVK
ncbi:clock controlled protein [Histoplasma capsulatum var. duboisii H88]|uniref:Clock controlled protein n=1 Tax=Ajellomyces capsulatus (strain H88) TaxID=544711 RepID=F0UQM9_AJEC8|nr:clock controlled protein [Histoplasma capsulatum var. duboisii H88]